MALYEELIEVYSDEIEEIKKLDKRLAQAEAEAEEARQNYLEKLYSTARIGDCRERREAQGKADAYYTNVVAPKIEKAGDLSVKEGEKRFRLDKAIEAEYAHVPFGKTREQGVKRFFELAFFGGEA